MKRFHSLILILALMFAFTATALAQDTESVCGDLSAEDCDLLFASAEAMADVTSGSQFVGVEAQVLNVPQTPFEELSFDISLDTSYNLSEGAASLADELQTMDAAAMNTLYSNPAELADTYTTLLEGTSAAVSFTANFSEELAALLTQSPQMAFPNSIALNMVLVDGVLYVDLSTLEPLMASSGMGMPGLTGWIGVDIIPMVAQSVQQSAAQGTMVVPATAGAAGPLAVSLGASDPSGVSTQFLNLERIEGGDEGVASFRTSVNWEAFVASPYFEQIVVAALQQNAAQMGAAPTQAEIDQAVTLGRMFGPALLEGITLEIVENVSTDTNYLESSEFTFDWDLSDLAMLQQMQGGGDLAIDDNAVVFLSIVTENSGLNEDVAIEAPADAFVVPAEMLNQLMSGGMSQ